jgi:hypothetical protein
MPARTLRHLGLATFAGLLAGLLFFVAPPRAAPPDNADQSLAPWFRSLRHPGTNQSCCDMADCRRVQYRSAGDHFQAYIGDDFPRWSNAPHAWVDVPNENVLHRADNPTGEGVACWFQGQILCFIEGNGS